VRLKLGGREMKVDMNLVAEIAGVITVGGIAALYHYSVQQP
jgi:hypothetical protein